MGHFSDKLTPACRPPLRGGEPLTMKTQIAAWLRRRVKVTAHPYEGLPVILAAGVGRSGTTALRHALEAHPLLDATGCENNIIFDVLETARQNCTYPSRRGTMRVARPAYDRQFRLLLLNLLWPEPRRGQARPRMLLAATDLTVDRAEYFAEAFPGGRIAYIVRNGIEVLSSRLTHPNFKDVPFEEHCRIWQRAAELAAWGGERADFALVRHEALLQPDPARAAIAAMLVRLRLPFEEACVSVVTKKQFHPTAFSAESTADAADLTRRQERWRLWTDDQRRVFETLCGKAMQSLGYALPWR